MPRLLAITKSSQLAFLAASSLLIPVVAHAETEPIRIEYRAIAGCPSVEEFRAEVFARTRSARPAADSETARTFVVTIESAKAGVVGSLVVREASGATLARKVDGARCEQVATALSLATALAIDPQAPEPTRDAAAGEAGVNRDGSPGSASSKSDGSPTDKKAEPPKAAPNESSERDNGEPDEDRTDEREVASGAGHEWWNAALGPSFETGISPRLSFGASAQLERHRHGPGDFVSGFGLELSWLQGPSYAVDTASSSFRFLLARPFICPSELSLFAALRAGPCLGAELGAVTGTGADLPSAATETRFWAAGDVRLRVRIEPESNWFVEFAGALVFPFTRYTFVFREPETQIYEVPWLGAAAGLRLGLRL
ncbi:MAG TPA: hypothetical protein VG937_36900 [Polyangiaceae bacterium]|nr:hypothetical protein [Polyangiaceae bacterium]